MSNSAPNSRVKDPNSKKATYCFLHGMKDLLEIMVDSMKAMPTENKSPAWTPPTLYKKQSTQYDGGNTMDPVVTSKLGPSSYSTPHTRWGPLPDTDIYLRQTSCHRRSFSDRGLQNWSTAYFTPRTITRTIDELLNRYGGSGRGYTNLEPPRNHYSYSYQRTRASHKGRVRDDNQAILKTLLAQSFSRTGSECINAPRTRRHHHRHRYQHRHKDHACETESVSSDSYDVSNSSQTRPSYCRAPRRQMMSSYSSHQRMLNGHSNCHNRGYYHGPRGDSAQRRNDDLKRLISTCIQNGPKVSPSYQSNCNNYLNYNPTASSSSLQKIKAVGRSSEDPVPLWPMSCDDGTSQFYHELDILLQPSMYNGLIIAKLIQLLQQSLFGFHSRTRFDECCGGSEKKATWPPKMQRRFDWLKAYLMEVVPCLRFPYHFQLWKAYLRHFESQSSFKQVLWSNIGSNTSSFNGISKWLSTDVNAEIQGNQCISVLLQCVFHLQQVKLKKYSDRKKTPESSSD